MWANDRGMVCGAGLNLLLKLHFFLQL